MMRLLLSVLAILSLVCCANMGPRASMEPGEESWQSILEHGTSKDSAYTKAMEWIAINFNSSNSVIQLQDKEAGKIILKGAAQFTNVIDREYAGYTLAITIKDQKLKMEATIGEILRHGAPANMYPPASEIPVIKQQFEAIKNGIAMKIKASENEDF